MGRYVYESDKCIWKYVFAGQSSEQCRIPAEIGVGHMVYNQRDTHDYLIIYCSPNAVKKLRNWVRINHPEVPINYDGEIWPSKGPYFPYMVWVYANYIEEQLKTRRGQRLRFWGEY
tara:strand:- start:171 stop:518 length:348 start_codon:yes stop_codon:yes gene_type:complete